MRVLFLCIHNSARSQLAEALLRHLAGGRVEVHSAGSAPSAVNPLALEVLAEIGVHHEGRPKSMEEFLGQSFDAVITVCDEAQEACPVFPGRGERIHWSLPDPSAAPEPERLAAFRRTRDDLLSWLRLFSTARGLA